MNIAMVADHNCGRISKEAYSLRQKGYDVSLVSSFLRDVEIYSGVYSFTNHEQMINIIKKVYKNIDIFHCHAEPFEFVLEIRKAFPKAKIVLDMHDSNYWRFGQRTVDLTGEKVVWHNEELAIKCADAFVFPSEACLNDFKNRINGKPSIYLPSANPLDWFAFEKNSFEGGLVIEGGLAETPLEIDQWRDYTRIIQMLKRYTDIFIYSPCFRFFPKENDITKCYKVLIGENNTRIKNHFDLLKTIGKHSWNLIGNYKHSGMTNIVWDYALPNKLFDGIAAGLPPVSLNCPEADKIINEHGIGLVINDNDPMKLIDNWDMHKQCRYNLMIHREKYAMEAYITRLTKLYNKIMEA